MVGAVRRVAAVAASRITERRRRCVAGSTMRRGVGSTSRNVACDGLGVEGQSDADQPRASWQARGRRRGKGGFRMKTMVSLLVLTAATPILAVTDFERFNKEVGKYATQLGGQPRGLCLCRDAALTGGVGYLLRGSSGPIGSRSLVTAQVSCHVPAFDENSGEQGATFVCEEFVPIAR